MGIWLANLSIRIISTIYPQREGGDVGKWGIMRPKKMLVLRRKDELFL